jgi:hypothetical protein
MESWLVALLVAYCLAGLVVYATTDTTSFASRIESKLLFVPYAIVQEYVFFFVAALWPLWLAMRARGERA